MQDPIPANQSPNEPAAPERAAPTKAVTRSYDLNKTLRAMAKAEEKPARPRGFSGMGLFVTGSY